MNIKALGILIGAPLLILIMAITLRDKNYQNEPYPEMKYDKTKITNKQNVSPPNQKLNVIKDYKAIMKTTAGDITIKLNNLDTPMAATNFAYLSRIGFYDGLTFHRVIKGFMIQGGDPKGDGTGGPGYSFADETFESEYKRGAIAMANSGKDTNGSQFFILHQDNLELQKSYTIFGNVIEGIEVVDKIAEAQVEDNGYGELSKPLNPVKIISIDIIEE